MDTMNRMLEHLMVNNRLTLFQHQKDAIIKAITLTEEKPGPLRMCVYLPTGKGKTITTLLCMKAIGVMEVLVIAPPATHKTWLENGAKYYMKVTTISHAKFRQKDYKVGRFTAVICDEFHLLGGVKGVGWKKFQRMSDSLEAPIIIASATPQYNDAERVYCILKVLEPNEHRGGFIQFLYAHCEIKVNPFGVTPLVEKLLHFDSAEEWLKSHPQVAYIPDEVEYEIVDIPIQVSLPDELNEYGYYRRRNKILNSTIAYSWAAQILTLIDGSGKIRQEIFDMLEQIIGEAQGKVILYATSSMVAMALAESCEDSGVDYRLVTGANSPMIKHRLILDFIEEESVDILIGTSTISTGVDGLDKVCDTLVIVHDTTDPSLRRQIVGRILPRGGDSDKHNKKFYRLVSA